MQQILRAVVLSITEALKTLWKRRVDFVYTLFLEKLLRPNSALTGFLERCVIAAWRDRG